MQLNKHAISILNDKEERSKPTAQYIRYEGEDKTPVELIKLYFEHGAYPHFMETEISLTLHHPEIEEPLGDTYFIDLVIDALSSARSKVDIREA